VSFILFFLFAEAAAGNCGGFGLGGLWSHKRSCDFQEFTQQPCPDGYRDCFFLHQGKKKEKIGIE
jgi:hypothetical protein